MKKYILVFMCTLSVGLAYAELPSVAPEPAVDNQGNIAHKVVHRLNDRAILVSPFETNPSKLAIPPTAGSTSTLSPILNHGGPVMTSVSAIYVVWYGNWNQTNGSDNSGGRQIILDALYGLSASGGTLGNGQSYPGITTGTNPNLLGSYTSSIGAVTGISSSTILEYFDSSYSQGKNLTDLGVKKVVQNAINKGNGWSAPNTNAIYLVLTSSDVNETSGFCTKYCGWHTYTSINNRQIKYAFVGNANRCLSACAPQSTSPNGNAGVDGMVSVIAHELEETATDPLLNAWYDSAGAENADKCAWTFGSSTGNMTSSSGPYYNVTMPTATGGTRNYLLQRALAQANSKCYVDASGSNQ